MATGMARGAADRGKKIAFGDGKRIRWDHNSNQIFFGNRNIARPGQETAPNLEWVPFYKGNRLYNKSAGDHWEWNLDFRPTPGEFFFISEERYFARKSFPNGGFAVIEPNVPSWKATAPNKQWPVERYDEVARRLTSKGVAVLQFVYPKGSNHIIPDAVKVKTPTFRYASALLERAELYIGPEGGMHHAAAALDVPGVVIFGGFIPTSVTGYKIHTNIAGHPEACGSFRPCDHCRKAMDAISLEQVLAAVNTYLVEPVLG